MMGPTREATVPFPNVMLGLLIIFAIVFALNLIPAFAPPTWMAMSYIGFEHPDTNPFVLALVGACAATGGRVALAKLSRVILRNNLLRPATRENLDAIKALLEERRTLTFSVLFLYAFSPLPSNQLFIAYGLTPLGLGRIAIPFFCGRFLSYAFWAAAAKKAAEILNHELDGMAAYFGVYFVVSQCVLLGMIYLFTKVDWRRAVRERKLHWRTS